MDLAKSGALLRELRKAKGMTQKQVAVSLGILPKTVSKWETGNGFPDVSTISALAELYGVSEKIILSGSKVKNRIESGNVKRTKFYVCPHCGSVVQGTGEYQILCCGEVLAPLKAKPADECHGVCISTIEEDFYVEFDHAMTKEHFIAFAAYVGVDRVLFIRLYPQQSATVRFPKMHGGKLYYYCNRDGLFEYKK